MATLDYELWDLTAGNLMGAYPGEEAALAEVRAGVRDDGVAAWRDVSLRFARVDGSDSRKIAEGSESITRAVASEKQTVVRS
jgi:hypothetical protein